MIYQVGTNGPWLSASIPNPPCIGSNHGIIRYNQLTKTLQVSDGNSWLDLPNSFEINLTPRTNEILKWAEQKMQEDQELKKLLEKNAALRELHNQFEMMKVLCAEK